jgi:hypothetical protein
MLLQLLHLLLWLLLCLCCVAVASAAVSVGHTAVRCAVTCAACSIGHGYIGNKMLNFCIFVSAADFHSAHKYSIDLATPDAAVATMLVYRCMRHKSCSSVAAFAMAD